jgi:hypothetical protein
MIEPAWRQARLILTSVDTFYAEVLQGLKAWSAKPPRLREQTDTTELAKEQDVPPCLVSTALSSQDCPLTPEREPEPSNP